MNGYVLLEMENMYDLVIVLMIAVIKYILVPSWWEQEIFTAVEKYFIDEMFSDICFFCCLFCVRQVSKYE